MSSEVSSSSTSTAPHRTPFATFAGGSASGRPATLPPIIETTTANQQQQQQQQQDPSSAAVVNDSNPRRRSSLAMHAIDVYETPAPTSPTNNSNTLVVRQQQHHERVRSRSSANSSGGQQQAIGNNDNINSNTSTSPQSPNGATMYTNRSPLVPVSPTSAIGGSITHLFDNVSSGGGAHADRQSDNNLEVHVSHHATQSLQELAAEIGSIAGENFMLGGSNSVSTQGLSGGGGPGDSGGLVQTTAGGGGAGAAAADDDEKINEDRTEKREVDEWLEKQTNMPFFIQLLYKHLFLVTLHDADTFEVVMRKLMLTAGFCYSPCSIAIGGYWLSLLADASDDLFAAYLLAGLSAVVVGIFVFVPAYFYARHYKEAGDGLMDYWIIGIGLCFCAIGVGAPRFPVTTAMYALTEAAVLVRSERMWLHIILAFVVYTVCSYNVTFIGRQGNAGGWSLAALQTVHEGSNIENLLMTLIGAFIVFLMTGALLLQYIEFVKLVNRSSSTASMSRDVASNLRKMNMGAIKQSLQVYHGLAHADTKLYNEFVSIVRTIADFAKFCPRDVVAQMMESGKGVSRSLENRNIVVFMSDVAAFTTLVEGVDSETLVSLMTTYFDVSSKLLAQYGAITIRYIGDALLSCWNEVPFQSTLACAAALHMQGAIKHVLAPKFERDAGFELQVRIGMHRGMCAVGIIGSKVRLQYDLIGNPPTLASRLEGLNKYFHSRIMVSEEMLSDTFCPDSAGSGNLEPTFAARRIGLIRVKGKMEPTAVYQILGVQPGADGMMENNRRRTSRRNSNSSQFNDSLISGGGSTTAPPLAGQRTVAPADGASSGGRDNANSTPQHNQLYSPSALSGNSFGVNMAAPAGGGGSRGRDGDSIFGSSEGKGGAGVGTASRQTLGTGTSSNMAGGGAGGAKMTVPVALGRAGRFFTAPRAAAEILEHMNAAQELYERARFGDAYQIYDSLLKAYTFPAAVAAVSAPVAATAANAAGAGHSGLSATAASTGGAAGGVGGALAAEVMTSPREEGGALGSSVGTAGSSVAFSPVVPGAVIAAATSGGSAVVADASVNMSGAGSPFLNANLPRWPNFLLEQNVNEELLKKLARLNKKLLMNPPEDFDPLVHMESK